MHFLFKNDGFLAAILWHGKWLGNLISNNSQISLISESTKIANTTLNT